MLEYPVMFPDPPPPILGRVAVVAPRLLVVIDPFEDILKVSRLDI
jgi:hypothetical protein